MLRLEWLCDVVFGQLDEGLPYRKGETSEWVSKPKSGGDAHALAKTTGSFMEGL